MTDIRLNDIEDMDIIDLHGDIEDYPKFCCFCECEKIIIIQNELKCFKIICKCCKKEFNIEIKK